MSTQPSIRDFAAATLARVRAAIAAEDAAGGAGGAAPRNTAQQNDAFCKTNPPPPRLLRPLSPRQMTAARMLLAGRRIGEVAEELGVHRYTVTRWKRDPAFAAELRRQLNRPRE